MFIRHKNRGEVIPVFAIENDDLEPAMVTQKHYLIADTHTHNGLLTLEVSNSIEYREDMQVLDSFLSYVRPGFNYTHGTYDSGVGLPIVSLKYYRWIGLPLQSDDFEIVDPSTNQDALSLLEED